MNMDRTFCNNSEICDNKECDRKFDFTGVNSEGHYSFSFFPECKQWKELEKVKWSKLKQQRNEGELK